MTTINLADAPAVSWKVAVDKENVLKAQLDIPDTIGRCINSGQFAANLILYRDQITKMIETIDPNPHHNKFSLQFTFAFHRNGIDKVAFLEDGPDRTFELDCYCNGE